ncbi:MAG: hypothetical protein J7K37_00080 [Candidatus Omnitrophica bacterium]|nr:hypothetical protein [Candidatus Omnitrophota bacterium]
MSTSGNHSYLTVKQECLTVVDSPQSIVGGRRQTADCGPYVLWAEVESIEYIGREQVYNLQVKGTHNFVANA